MFSNENQDLGPASICLYCQRQKPRTGLDDNQPTSFIWCIRLCEEEDKE